MVDYVFVAASQSGEELFVRTLDLATDIQASVMSFNLVRDHRTVAKVTVASGGRVVLARVREGGKSRVIWGRSLQAAGQLA